MGRSGAELSVALGQPVEVQVLTFSRSPASTCASCSVREVNLDRLRELAGHLENATAGSIF